MPTPHTLRLPQTRAAWHEQPAGALWPARLKREICALPVTALPLQAALQYGDRAIGQPRSMLLLDHQVTAGELQLRVGVFFASVVSGCHCSDDPGPPETATEYAELRLRLALADEQAHCEVSLDA